MRRSRQVTLLSAFLLLAAGPVCAQQISLDLGGDQSLAGRSMLLLASITLLSLAPGLAIMVTCFPFIVTVLSILRQGLGLQAAPPNMLIISLALFLTWFVMEPTMMQSWNDGIRPFLDGQLDVQIAFARSVDPFRLFMAARIDPATFDQMAALRPNSVHEGGIASAPLSLLVPSFMLSEVSRAFEIGFLVYLPFLIIDLVVSAILMSMGMMMVPPAAVALPFKLAFFVVADGWSLVSGALVRSYM
ncbi:flagellar type III secretion system pore protein FliP [Paenirhodobacter sp.]|uniref:flagellar type III secretion system pore protein FliP n=1 Tax=Paenirhodobacter sp. TaxID=1965326 RepID=UPI003B406FD3